MWHRRQRGPLSACAGGTSGPWQFLSFQRASPAAAVFFSAGATAVRDPDSLVSHQPDVTGLAEAWIEGGSALGELLVQLGARRCGPTSAPDGRTGERFGLSRGRVVIVPPRAAVQPRVLGVVLRLRNPGSGSALPHPNFWVRYEYRQNQSRAAASRGDVALLSSAGHDAVTHNDRKVVGVAQHTPHVGAVPREH
jgi:hypothetical protein